MTKVVPAEEAQGRVKVNGVERRSKVYERVSDDQIAWPLKNRCRKEKQGKEGEKENKLQNWRPR